MDLLQKLKICFLSTLVVQTHSLNSTGNVTDENIKNVLSSTVSYEDKIKRGSYCSIVLVYPVVMNLRKILHISKVYTSKIKQT